MKNILLLIILLPSLGESQNLGQLAYENSLKDLRAMLEAAPSPSFKRAVFITENAYLDNRLSYEEFDNHIKSLADKCLKIANQSDLVYKESDKATVERYGAVFRLMKDTIRFYQDSNKFYYTKPYTYDFEDFMGDRDWQKMFVTKLLSTHAGNCHSLPFLYKILCEEIETKAYLAMAPNHTYIKLWCKQTGWYNTELTSGYFPIDAWIMASGYIPLNAVQNRIYLDTLSQKQSVAVCVIDLANGYERKFQESQKTLDFILECCDLALAYYPKYVNGLLLKAETLKSKFELLMKMNSAEYPSDLFKIPEAKAMFESMRKLYVEIHELGYRKMPTDMYLAWLAELKKEKSKYQNHQIQNINRN